MIKKHIVKLLNKFTNVDTKENRRLHFYDEETKKIEFSNKTIYEYLKNEVGENLDLFALNYFGNRITYGEMFRKINLLAKALRFYDLKKGDVVSICLPNTPEAVEVFYAVNKIGAVAEMIHPLSGKVEFDQFLNISKPKIIFLFDQCYDKFFNCFKDNPNLKIILVDISEAMNPLYKYGYKFFKRKKIECHRSENVINYIDFLNKGYFYHKKDSLKISASDVAVILHSGGTTGKPKGIMLSNYNFNALARQGAVNVIDVEEGDRIVTLLPIFHGFGLGVCVHCPLSLMVEVILVPEFDEKYFSYILKKFKPNVIAGVPTLWEAMIKSKGLKCVSLESLKYMISGGDSLTLELEKNINSFLHNHKATINISKGYGMTECTAAAIYTFPDSNELGAIGRAMIGNEIKICKPNSTTRADPLEEGEICVCGPTVMIGYMNDLEETKNVLKKHDDGKLWLHTGDIGYMKENGLVYFTQRIKRIIVSSGFNIYPSQIEALIETHPKVLKCVVIGVPDPYKMQVPKAIIVLKEGVLESTKIKAEIRILCRKNLAQYSQVKNISFRSSLPETLYKKIDYKRLEEEERDAEKSEYEA